MSKLMSKEQLDRIAMEQEIARLKEEKAKLLAEKAKLIESKNKALTLKVSLKKALSIYGLGRYPVTLYKEQWLRLLGAVQIIKDYITEHDAELASKE